MYRTQPNYAILVDTRDRVDAQATYVPEENIEILSNVKVRCRRTDIFWIKDNSVIMKELGGGGIIWGFMTDVRCSCLPRWGSPHPSLI